MARAPGYPGARLRFPWIGGTNMSTPIRDNRVRAVWRIGITLALLLGILVPAWSVSPVLAQQGTLPETAAAAPAGTALFQVFDLDRGGRQWQQTGTLLERIGLPNAPERWVDALLEIGARKGNFTEADLNALLGGELALVVTPVAVERAMEHHERHQQQGDDTATPLAHAWDEPLGVTTVLLPGDPDAGWDYVERQVADMASRLDVPVEEISHGSGDVLWVEVPDLRMRLAKRVLDALGHANLEPALASMLGDTGVQARPGFATGRAGDFIITGATQADVNEIIDV